MKKVITAFLIGLCLIHPSTVRAEEIEVHKVTATAYAPTGNLTYMETVPKFGVVAGKKEWLGSTMMIWWDDGDGIIKPQNFYGAFSCEDLGGSEAIKNGYVIDVFLPNKEDAIQFGSKKVIIQVIKSKG